MMRIADPYLHELTHEASVTERVLDRVPEAHLGWRPHAKSLSLGQLALHVAMIPGQLSQFISDDAMDFGTVARTYPGAGSRQELVDAHGSSLDCARSYLASLSDERATAVWTLSAGGHPIFAAPRTVALRSFLFNHWYHHRGQLLVYLRLLDVPVPSVYGPTADENPFVAA